MNKKILMVFFILIQTKKYQEIGIMLIISRKLDFMEHFFQNVFGF